MADVHRTIQTQAPTEAVSGVICASCAFLIWGLSPIYYKALKSVPAFEILMHRIVWSFLFLLTLVIVKKQWPNFKAVLADRSKFLILTATTIMVAGNWFVFIWAINHDRILETSLGYFINPLVNVLLGMVFLKERLRRPQWIAVLLAGIGVGYLTVRFGKLPWVSLFLALTFGFYGLIRKAAPVGALIGLTVETMLLSLPALACMIYLEDIGRASFLHIAPRTDGLLIGAALVTALPLLFFTTGARRLHLSTVGILQYIAPSCTFLLAVFVYGEPLQPAQLFTFACIWSALIIYSTDSVRHYRYHAPNRSERRWGKK